MHAWAERQEGQLSARRNFESSLSIPGEDFPEEGRKSLRRRPIYESNRKFESRVSQHEEVRLTYPYMNPAEEAEENDSRRVVMKALFLSQWHLRKWRRSPPFPVGLGDGDVGAGRRIINLAWRALSPLYWPLLSSS